MNQGRYVFTQLVDFLPRKHFEWLVSKYEGNKYVKSFSCWNHLLVLLFGQLSNREGLPDLIVTLTPFKFAFHHAQGILLWSCHHYTLLYYKARISNDGGHPES